MIDGEKIISFPKLRRTYDEWELVGEKLLTQAGVPPAGIAWIITDLRPRYAALVEMTPGFSWQPETEHELRFSEWFKVYNENAEVVILCQLLSLEVSLYLARGGEPFKPNTGPGADWLILA